jgi:hypothetical protein
MSLGLCTYKNGYFLNGVFHVCDASCVLCLGAVGALSCVLMLGILCCCALIWLELVCACWFHSDLINCGLSTHIARKWW